jgi:hypothetical protein
MTKFEETTNFVTVSFTKAVVPRLVKESKVVFKYKGRADSDVSDVS